MKRILYFDHTAKAGGGEIALLRLVSALDRDRFTPVVLLGEEGKLCSLLAEARVETHVLPLPFEVGSRRKETIGFASLGSIGAIRDCLTYARRMADFLQGRRIDLVHTNSLKADTIGAFAARMAHLPVVWHVRDRIANDYLPPTAAIGFRALCGILPTHIIANSKATLETLGRARSRASVVYDGMPVNANTEVVWIPDHPPVVGLLGRISPWKGQHVFIRAAKLVCERFPAARFRIIGAPLFGEEDYERGLHQLVCELGLSDAVVFAGFRDDVKEELERLNVVVHASTVAEPFGQVVFEAMYYSRPVVATNAGGVPEIVVDGETGMLVPMGDEHAMAEAIISLLEDPRRARGMGISGHERVLSNFSIHQTAREVAAIYEKILG